MDKPLQIERSHVSEQPKRPASLVIGSAQIAAYSSLRFMIRSPRGMKRPERAQNLRHEESIGAAEADRHWEAAVLNEAAKRRSRETKDGNDLSLTDVEMRSKHGFHLGPLFHLGSCGIMCRGAAPEKVLPIFAPQAKG
jgi:hypothetical protein